MPVRARHFISRFVLPLLAAGALAGATICARHSYDLCVQSERLSEEIYRSKSVSGQTLDKLRQIFRGNSDIAFKMASRDLFRERSWHQFVAFAGLSLLAVGFAHLSALKGRVALLLALATAFMAAAFGIMTPALAMTAQQSTPVGDFALFHESRGILATIQQLLGRDGSLVVGIPLLVFSVVLPLAKSVLLAAALLFRGAARSWIMAAIKRVGRWSMADVFVVAVLLSFFATSHNRFMEADVLPGIAFFAYYAILSIPVAAMIERYTVQAADGHDNR